MNQTLLDSFETMLEGFDELEALNEFVDQLDEPYREELQGPIRDRREALSGDGLTLSAATPAEMADYYENHPEELEMVVDAVGIDAEEAEDSAEESEDVEVEGEVSAEEAEAGAKETKDAEEEAEAETEADVADETGADAQQDANAQQEDAAIEDYEDAQYSEGDKVKWSWQGSTVHGKVSNVGDSFTVEGNEISGDEGEAVYKIDEWDDDAEEFNSGNVAKPESSLSASQKNMEPSESEQEDELSAFAETELTDASFDASGARANLLAHADNAEQVSQFFLIGDASDPSTLDLPVATVEDGEIVLSAEALEGAEPRVQDLEDLTDEDRAQALHQLRTIRSAVGENATDESADDDEQTRQSLRRAAQALGLDVADDADTDTLAAAVEAASAERPTIGKAIDKDDEDDGPSGLEMLDRLSRL